MLVVSLCEFVIAAEEGILIEIAMSTLLWKPSGWAVVSSMSKLAPIVITTGRAGLYMSTVVDSVTPTTIRSISHERTERQRRETASNILRDAVAAKSLRHDWTREQIAAIYYQPLMELAFQSVSWCLLIVCSAAVVCGN